MPSPRGIGSDLWVARKSQPAYARRRVWVVTCTCSQLGSHCGGPHAHLWGHRPQFHLAPHLWCSCQPWQKQVHRCAHLWGQRLQPAHPTLWTWGPAVWEHTVRGSLELEGPITMISCLSGRPSFFSLDSLVCVVLAPSEHLHSNQPQSSPWDPTSEAWASAHRPQLLGRSANCFSGRKCWSGMISVVDSLCFAFWAPVAAFPLEILELPSLPEKGFLSVQKLFLLPLPSWGAGPIWFYFNSYFLISVSLPFYTEIIVVQSLSCVQLFATPRTAACQASLSCTISWSLLKLISIESVMPSNHLVLCRPLILLHSIFPSIRVFSNESVLCIKWPKYCSFIFSISPSSEYSWLISFRMDWFNLLAANDSLLQHHSVLLTHLLEKPTQTGCDNNLVWSSFTCKQVAPCL